MKSVLTKENIPYEDEALSLIARRAAGSVRDSMSLLGQCLAFMPDSSESVAHLEEVNVREVLGLAGVELMDNLLCAISDQNIKNVTQVIKELLLQGVDMGFFLREFANLWRNLFVLREAGKEALSQIPVRELVRLEEHAANFSLTFIHAAWQMTLENQRRILQSLEPSAGLELLLLNLALLPRLLPLKDLNTSELNHKDGVFSQKNSEEITSKDMRASHIAKDKTLGEL